MGIKLLLADDSPTIGKILSMALQSEAYDIKAVLNADDALKELKANPPFFFLVDLTLPNKDGYAFAKLIRSDSKLNKIKVMLLSSAFDPVDPQKLAECGADGYIVKPFDPSDLRKKLREIADAPPVFPLGSHVAGSMSGMQVHAPIDMPLTAPPSAAAASEIDLAAPAEDDADSILSQLMRGEDNDLPLAEPPTTNPSLASVSLNAPEEAPPPPAEPVLDLSTSFAGNDATAMIDFSAAENDFLVVEKEKSLAKTLSTLEASKNLPPAFEKAAASPPQLPPAKPPGFTIPTIPAAPPAFTPPAANNEPLSASAQALSAFFEAELDNKPAAEAKPEGPPPLSMAPSAPPMAPPPAPPKVEEESFFDASLESIEWATPAKESLDSWSSNAPSFASPASMPENSPPTLAPDTTLSSSLTPLASSFDNPPPFAPPPEEKPPAFSPAKNPAPKISTGAGASSAGNPLFDTGGSNFTFADDYIQRITKAFSGAVNEEVPKIHEGVFHSESHDLAHQPPPKKISAPSAGFGSAWSPDDAKKIEQLVREEVQMVVREVVEKVAWEVIPELAENIIKKELDKVLKQMET